MPVLPPFEALLNAFATYFVTIDPPGMAAIFLGLTSGYSASQRRGIALRGTALGITILITFSFVGGALLDLLGITMPAFRVAGGLLLFWISAEMVFEKRVERREGTVEKAASDSAARGVAAFPLAVPLIAGPGAISASILLSENFTSLEARAAHVGIILAVGLLLCLSLLLAAQLRRYISDAAGQVVTRLLGILLAALAIQFIADGVRALMA